MAERAANSPSPPHVDPPATPSYQTLTRLGVGVTVIAALYFGKDILLPITVAVLLSFVLSPLVGTLRRLRIPRVVAVVFSVGLALAIIGGVGALLGSQIVEVAGDLPLYQTTIEKKVEGPPQGHSRTHCGGREPFSRDTWPSRADISSTCIAGG